VLIPTTVNALSFIHIFNFNAAGNLYLGITTRTLASTDYIPTTTTQRWNAYNVPRIDYTGGGCGKLLLEPQRTNLLLQGPRQFDDAAWGKTNATITANTQSLQTEQRMRIS
jgi:hypothetical protein